MLIVLCSYIFIFYILLGLSTIWQPWINLKGQPILISALLGMFVLLNMATFYAIFWPLDLPFFGFVFIASTLLILYHKQSCKSILNNAWKTWQNFAWFSKILMLGIIVVSLIHTSSLPALADNESYYIQTIKWLNNYGFVKGLANLHLFLGQVSGWHILQSSLNFQFLYSNFNDLNGFIVILTSFLAFEKLSDYQKNLDNEDLFVALISLTWLGQFLFISSPSTDLPLLLLVPLICYYFMQCFKEFNQQTFLLMFVLTLLVILIKVTIVPILILSFLIWIRNYRKISYPLVIATSSLALLGFILKNLIVTGFPLYPLHIGNEMVDLDWKLNENIQSIYYQWTVMYAWKMNDIQAFESLGHYDKFVMWLRLPRATGLINKTIVLFLILFPIIFYKKIALRYLYGLFVFQFILFYWTSPQYRFFLPVLTVMGLLFATVILHHRIKIIKLLLSINLLILFITGISGFDFGFFSNNQIMQQRPSFQLSQIIWPRSNTQFPSMPYQKERIGNLIYYSPDTTQAIFFQTSDGPLPCANKMMIDYFKANFDHVPQQRTHNIQDGFRSEVFESIESID